MLWPLFWFSPWIESARLMLFGVPIIFYLLDDSLWELLSFLFYCIGKCVSLALPFWCIIVISSSVSFSCCISLAICSWLDDVDSYNSTRKMASSSIVFSAEAWYYSRVDLVALSFNNWWDYLILKVLIDDFEFNDFLLKIFEPVFKLIFLFLRLIELSFNGTGKVLFLFLKIFDLSFKELILFFKFFYLIFKVVHDESTLFLKFIKLIWKFIELKTLALVKSFQIFVWWHLFVIDSFGWIVFFLLYFEFVIYNQVNDFDKVNPLLIPTG